MSQNFLILVPRRRPDLAPERLLLEQVGAYGKITRTSDWVSLFNYASINTYDVIFISCATYADEHKLWSRDLKRLNPHQVIILYTATNTFKSTLVLDSKRIFGYLHLQDVEQSLPALMQRLEKYQYFRDNLSGKVSKKLLHAGGFGEFVGNSAPMLDVYRQMTRVAGSEYTVLIQGESGSGKELVARTIHKLSPRAENPFVSINCAAIPENLLESELFGFEKGAFTGANQKKAGKFELANGGTLFLDEIGDMPLGLQVKLLRVLEDHKIQPLGSVKETEIDIRLVTATHRNLEEQISKGEFREDLHYRLNVIPLELPPLRQRTSDMTLLLMNFLGKLLRGDDQPIRSVDWGIAEALGRLPFKGNVRELGNVLTRSVIGTDGPLLDASALPAGHQDQESRKIPESTGTVSEIHPLWQVERDHLEQALQQLGGNISQVAQQLEISRTAIYRKIKKYEIQINLQDNPTGNGELDA